MSCLCHHTDQILLSCLWRIMPSNSAKSWSQLFISYHGCIILSRLLPQKSPSASFQHAAEGSKQQSAILAAISSQFLFHRSMESFVFFRFFFQIFSIYSSRRKSENCRMEGEVSLQQHQFGRTDQCIFYKARLNGSILITIATICGKVQNAKCNISYTCFPVGG